MSDRLFSVRQANALIPKLELIMERLQRGTHVLREGVAELARVTGAPADDLTMAEIVELRPDLQPVIAEVEALLGEIEDCGGKFKGLELGLVDFPAEIDGEVVLLCWQYGEKEISHYHTVEGGFASRKPLHPRAQPPRYLQ
ncbi:DUF2203 domain-containing protein [Candidatus Binatia bacterium]|nr:DUF2203 domain-containing protein [Candidatus Binatia bacterium]